MLIRYGFNIDLDFFQPSTLVTVMDVHPDRWSDIVSETSYPYGQARRARTFFDAHGNFCRRIDLDGGTVSLRREGLIRDGGLPDPVFPTLPQTPVADLPDETLQYLTASRYCETDLMAAFAWQNFGWIEGGWARVQAICDFVQGHLRFDYALASPTRTAVGAFQERVGVCRDFNHLAVTLCRCLNIPARYCNGYLGDIGVPFNPDPMDFNAWFEAYLDGRWYTFDARHNQPRIGRILLARGRDAADIPMIHSYGQHSLGRFEVITEEVPEAQAMRAVA
ncbi:transglutaminase-like domain-containing protein [Labrys monachus]|uniref:Transglutaminase-like putative cysteine protease n=1 Tax=Labrys monachus TaxID=217067 RepID=A0ABU0FLH9_9HYPH|nr:transglutaminase family protein [Labrys monachus]MDQ0395450.1 transglutaminase-like putative cysteine protease [Labrys monachus]